VEIFKSKGSGDIFIFKRFAQSKDMKEWVASVLINAVKVLPPIWQSSCTALLA
jgi:hypothetical protein